VVVIRKHKIFAGKPEEKRLLGRPRHRWENNVRLDFGETVMEDMDWIHLAQDRIQRLAVMHTIIKFRFP
jgi:hypothetical protein